MNSEQDYVNWFVKELDESPLDCALSALTALILKNTSDKQHDRYLQLKSFLISEAGCSLCDQKPILNKVREIYLIHIEEEKETINNLVKIEEALAQQLQIKYSTTEDEIKGCGNCCDKKEEKQIARWW